MKRVIKALVLRCLRKAFKVKELDHDFGAPEEVFDRFVIFKGFLGEVRLHRLNCPKWPAVSHDHPWDFIAIILRGGYYEHTEDGCRWMPAGSIVHRRADQFHNVATLGNNRDSWSLVFAGAKYKDWSTKSFEFTAARVQ